MDNPSLIIDTSKPFVLLTVANGGLKIESNAPAALEMLRDAVRELEFSQMAQKIFALLQQEAMGASVANREAKKILRP